MPVRLPSWYVDDLKREIAVLREMLGPLKNPTGSVGAADMGTLTKEMIDRHEKAISDLQSILDDDRAHRT